MTSPTIDPVRLFGRYYTPSFVVEAMLRLALDPLLETRDVSDSLPRILDPACGDGAFLGPVFERLKNWAAYRLDLGERQIAKQLCGVDIDERALESLRARLPVEVALGDALTGPGFGESLEPVEAVTSPNGLNWSEAFPEAADEGGFDLVIGNPPYRRELASKAVLARLRQSPLGRKWHQPRLDLWAYFVHRGLDVLKPGGRMCFILPSYWTASKAAGQLIERLKAETTIRDVIQLGRSTVFSNVTGRHLILNLAKGFREEPCRVWDLTLADRRVADWLSMIPGQGQSRPVEGFHHAPRVYSIRQAELFRHRQLCLTRSEPSVSSEGIQDRPSLKSRFEVRQGIVENPRRITKKMAPVAKGYRVGEGVFVLSSDELDRLQLTTAERQLLRPYYKGTDIDRFSLADDPSEWLLYLTRESAPDLEAFPNIQSHLARFRTLLENRREVRNARISWWHLHWPRVEVVFLSPRILMPRMGANPRFVFCDRPAFVGFAMHVIRERNSQSIGDAMSLKALTGILNSRWAAKWFEREAKHRGVALDISGMVLNRFPLPAIDFEAESAMGRLVMQRQGLAKTSPEVAALEAEMETLVERWYSLGIDESHAGNQL